MSVDVPILRALFPDERVQALCDEVVRLRAEAESVSNLKAAHARRVEQLGVGYTRLAAEGARLREIVFAIHDMVARKGIHGSDAFAAGSCAIDAVDELVQAVNTSAEHPRVPAFTPEQLALGVIKGLRNSTDPLVAYEQGWNDAKAKSEEKR